MRHVFHLVKRFTSSWSRKDVTEDELNMVRSLLTASEFNLWNQFSIATDVTALKLRKGLLCCFLEHPVSKELVCCCMTLGRYKAICQR